MRDVVTLSTDRLQDTLDAMRRLVVEGARSAPVRDLLAAATMPHKLAGVHQPAPELLLREIYEDLRAHFVFVPNPYGEQELQSAPETLLRGGGACDDGTILVLSVARSLGLHTRFGVLSGRDEAGELRGFHVLGQAETEPDAWTSLDLSEGAAYGAAPRLPEAVDVRFLEVTPRMAPGLGFLAELLGLGAALIGAKGAKDAAHESTRQAEITADSARETAAANERTTATAVRGATDVATIQSLTTLGQTRVAGVTVSRALAFLKEVWPTLAALMALKYGLSLIASATGGAAQRRRAA